MLAQNGSQRFLFNCLGIWKTSAGWGFVCGPTSIKSFIPLPKNPLLYAAFSSPILKLQRRTYNFHFMFGK